MQVLHYSLFITRGSGAKWVYTPKFSTTWHTCSPKSTLDTLHMEIRLPPEKLCRLKQVIIEWSSKSWCTKRDLESLIGLLLHASTVVKPGRSFLRRMIELNKVAHNPQRPIRLNQAFHSDLAWWRLYLKAWNGTSMLSTLAVRDHEETITTDASGLWGCGGFLAEPLVPAAMGVTGSSHKPVHCNKGDAAYPSVMCYLGQALARKTLFQSDNEAVTTALNTKSCKDTSLMHMLRCLFFFSGTLFLLIHSKPYPWY